MTQPTVFSTGLKLSCLGIAYYFFKIFTFSEGEMFYFAITDTLGYIVKVIIQLYLMYQAIKALKVSMGDQFKVSDARSFSMRAFLICQLITGIAFAGIISNILPSLESSANTVTFLTLPFFLIFAAVFGATVGLIYGSLLKEN